VANIFLGQWTDFDETNTYQLKYFSSMEIMGATGLGGLWALEWAWHPAESNLRCAGISGICTPNPSIVALIVFEISAFIRTDGQTDMARSTRLVILTKNIYTLWGRRRFLLPSFPRNRVYRFTLRVTGKITICYHLITVCKSPTGSCRL